MSGPVYKSGPCPHCHAPILADVNNDSISHAEPVCASFESTMRKVFGPRNRGRADYFDMQEAKLKPDPTRRPRAPSEPWGRS